MNVSQCLIWLGSFLGRFTFKTAKNTILTANYDLKFCRVTLKHKYVSALCHNIHFLVVHKWMSCLMRWYHRKNGQKCTSNGISRWYPMVNVCQYHISIIIRKSLFLNLSNILKQAKMPFLRHITAFYGIKWYPMVTALLESLRECVSVPCQHLQTRVAVFESNCHFFYGILRHFAA